MNIETEIPEITELVVIEPANLQSTFSTKGALQPLLDKIAERAKSFPRDIKTSGGRKNVASLAAKVAKAKVALDGMGEDLVRDLKKLPKQIDEQRKVARDFLDKLRDEIRSPLTEWEEEQERKEAERAAAAEAERKRQELEMLHELANYENEAFDRKRAEAKAKQEQERKDREERIAREAEERSRREAEAKVQRELEEAQRLQREAVEAQERAEREKVEAEAIAKQAEERAAREKHEAETRAKVAEERQELERKESAERFEREHVAALEREEKARKDAIEQERRRLAEEQRKAAEETAKREANVKHRRLIIGQIAADLGELGLTDEQSAKVAAALANGNIRNVEVKF